MKRIVVSIFLTLILSFISFFGITSCSDDSKPATEPEIRGSIQGIIRDSKTNQNVIGASVTIEPSGESLNSQNEGKYFFQELLPGNYTINVIADGYIDGNRTVIIEAGDEKTLDFNLVPLSKIYGVVKCNQSSQSLADVKVQITETGESKFTNADGIYRFEDLVGGKEYTLSASKNGYSSGIESLIIEAGEEREANILLDVITPVLDVSPSELNFGNINSQLSFQMSNITSCGLINYSIEADAEWISFSQTQGNFSTEIKNIIVNIDRSNLGYNSYYQKITVNSNAGSKQIDVIVNIENPELEVSTDKLDFGSNIQDLSFTISNVGSGNLNWDVTDDKEWISCTPISGSNQKLISVSIDRSLLPNYGNYLGQITVASNEIKSEVLNKENDIPLKKELPIYNRSTRASTQANDRTTKYIDVLVEYKTDNQPPSASYIISPNNGNLQTYFQFDASVSSDDSDDVSQLQVRWKWETGSIFTPWIYTKTASHKYDSYGTKNVTLEVKDSGGLVSSISKDVEVLNEPPEAEFVITPDTGTTETNFIFNASGCSNNEDPTSALQVRWDFDGNGSWDTNYSIAKTATHIFTAAGNYTPKLGVKDTEGFTAITVKNLVVTAVNTAPTAIFTISTTAGTVETNFIFNASGCSDNEDPTSALQVRWDFDGNGSWDTNYSIAKTATHIFTAAGNYTPKLGVKDLGGLTDTEIANDIIIYGEMVFVQGGIFQMGDRVGNGSGDEKPVHEVTISSFYMGKYEITQAEYQRVMDSNPSLNNGINKPVENITWRDAVDFCDWLSILEGYEQCYTFNGTSVICDFSKNGYRLPTEAEWEYASRGGVNHTDNYQYSGTTANLTDYAYYSVNSGSVTHEVGSKFGNQLGLYDMSGNLFEWCWDWHVCNYYSFSPSYNPHGPSSGISRVIRGGSCNNTASFCTISARIGIDPVHSYEDLGFRVVRTP